MKHILWFFLVAALVIAGVLLMKPRLAEDLMPGLWAGKHKETVRLRATELIGHLSQNQLDPCVAMTDPAFVRQHGVNAVKLRFGLLHILSKAGKLTPDDVQLGEIRLSPDNQRAEIEMQLRVGGQWKPQKPGRWVRVDDAWYFSPD